MCVCLCVCICLCVCVSVCIAPIGPQSQAPADTLHAGSNSLSHYFYTKQAYFVVCKDGTFCS